jgi:integrase
MGLAAHGFRGTASTHLHELGFNSDVVEKQLAHVPGNKVKAIYSDAQYVPERTEMMQKWADYLDSIKTSDVTDGNPSPVAA